MNKFQMQLNVFRDGLMNRIQIVIQDISKLSFIIIGYVYIDSNSIWLLFIAYLMTMRIARTWNYARWTLHQIQ